MIFDSTETIKLMKEYNVFQFHNPTLDLYRKVDNTITVHVTDDVFEDYPVSLYHDWFALNFIVYMNLIHYELFNSMDKIPLIKVFKDLIKPFSFGLKETKEFVENLVVVHILEDTSGKPRYKFTMSGKILLSKLNRNFVYLDNLIAKSLLMGNQNEDGNIYRYHSLRNNLIENYFNFYKIYDENTQKLIIGD